MADRQFLLFGARIKEAYPNLSDTEKRIADYILDNTDDVLKGTAVSLANRVHTSTATIIRFCKACGFTGLSDLKICLRYENEATKGASSITHSQKNESAATVKQKILGQHEIIINSMMAEWNDTVYELAVEKLISAEKILVVGEGGSRSSAMCLYDILLQLGLPCELSTDSVFEVLQIARLTDKDVLIGLTYTGCLKTTLDSFKLAKSLGVFTIGLIGTTSSPIQKYVDIRLNTDLLKGYLFSSSITVRISELSVIEVLYSILSTRLSRYLESPSNVNKYVEIRRCSSKDDDE